MNKIAIIAVVVLLASCSDMSPRESSSGATASGVTSYGSLLPNPVRSEDPQSMPATGP